MTFLIISGNPKKDGLCHTITREIIAGATDGGAEMAFLNMETHTQMTRCHICGNGWGECRNDRRCTYGDDGFNEAQELIKQADAIALVTPVYWGETAEWLKSFMDRFRRCEFGGSGALSSKRVLLVASAGGSGNGILTALEQMDRFCRHTGAVIFDYIGINRWNNDYKQLVVYKAAKAMAEGRPHGETVSY